MDNNIYEMAKEEYFNKLKENKKAVRRLQANTNKALKQDPRAIDAMEKIKEYSAIVEKNKAAFVEKCKKHFRTIFFYGSEYAESEAFKAIMNYDNFMEAHKDLFNVDVENLDYESCIKILKDEDLKARFANNLTSEINYTILTAEELHAKCEELSDSLATKLVKMVKKRDFLAKFINVKKLNGKIAQCNADYINFQYLTTALKELLTKLENSAKYFESVSKKYKNDENYKNVTFNSGLLKSYEKYLKDLKERINYTSGNEEKIEDLKSLKTKNNIINNAYNKDVRNKLATDPKFLIELGRADAIAPKEANDKQIVNFLVNKFIDSEEDLGISE